MFLTALLALASVAIFAMALILDHGDRKTQEELDQRAADLDEAAPYLSPWV